MKEIYIDSNIFISIFLERPGHDKIREFFEEEIRELDLKFCTSEWTFAEVVKVLVTQEKIDSGKVAEYVNELTRVKRLYGVKFDIVDVSREKDYDFSEFFYDTQKMVLEYRNGFQDAIHSLIMRNNGIDMILTSDAGFEGIDGVEVINPLKR